MTEAKTQETRFAENEVRFREANERIASTGERLQLQQPLPFVCECGRPDCTTIVRVLPRDYERARAVSNRFIYAPGHEQGLPESHLLERLEHAVLIEKTGESARVAEATDPRRDDD